jgi:methylmalonyl-CoA mutase N-terminal domain/subunit
MLRIQQRERLTRLRERRDSDHVNGLLSHLENSAKGTVNLMPLFIECVRNHITLGEICNTLRRVWGEYHAFY